MNWDVQSRLRAALISVMTTAAAFLTASSVMGRGTAGMALTRQTVVRCHYSLFSLSVNCSCIRQICDLCTLSLQRMKNAVPLILAAPVVSVCRPRCVVTVTQTAGIAQMRRAAQSQWPAPPSTAAPRVRSVWCRSGSVMEIKTAKMAQMRR